MRIFAMRPSTFPPLIPMLLRPLLVPSISCFALSLHAQTIAEPGFENWPPNCPVNTAPNGWTNFSTSLGPDQAGSCAGTVVSYEGSSHMNLVWYSVTALEEGAAQVITGLAPGSTYEVSFYAIHNQGLYADLDPTKLQAFINGTTVLTTPDLVSGIPWALFSFTFVADSTAAELGFQVIAGSTGTTGCVGVDAVSIALGNSVNEGAAFVHLNVGFDATSRTLHFRAPTVLRSVVLMDGLGRVAASEPANATTAQVDMAAHAPGVYLYRVVLADGRMTTGQVVVE